MIHKRKQVALLFMIMIPMLWLGLSSCENDIVITSTELTIRPTALSIPAGSSLALSELAISALYSDGSEHIISSNLTYAIANQEQAEIQGSVIRANAPGLTSLEVSYGSIKGEIPLMVEHSTRNILINEVMISNRSSLEDDFGFFSDWIELYNSADYSIDLEGWFLSDSILNTEKWQFTGSLELAPGDRLLLFASDRDLAPGATGPDISGESIPAEFYHTNYKLDAGGDSVILSYPDGEITDSLGVDSLNEDWSLSRRIDGGTDWSKNEYATPNCANDLVLAAPVYSASSGFYPTLDLSFDSAPADAVIKFTINDGMSYDEWNTLRDEDAAGVNSRGEEYRKENWQIVSNKGGIDYSNPVALAAGCNVIKARYVYNGFTLGPEATATYFINEENDLPIFSLIIDPYHLWDNDTGIYVEGDNPFNPNYNEDWRRPGTIQFFEDTTTTEPDFEAATEVRVFGNATREFPDKSIAFYAQDERFAYDFFNTGQTSFRSFVLRTSASDWPRSMIRDGLADEIAEVAGLDLDKQAYRPSILYINGQYWGIMNLREKVNEWYLQDNYPAVNPSNVDIISGIWQTEIFEGNDIAYTEMYDFFQTADLFDPDQYTMAAGYIDVASFMDYIILETFINNTDWPSNNVKAWRSREEEAKWRWILYDSDAGFDTEEYWTEYRTDGIEGTSDFDSLSILMDPALDVHPAVIFRSLMKSPVFYNGFIARYESLLDAATGELRSAALIPILETLEAGVASEIPRHFDRWDNDSYYAYMDQDGVRDLEAPLDKWGVEISVIETFASERPGYMRSIIDTFKIAYPAPAEPTNYVLNGDFETEDLTGWANYSSGSATTLAVDTGSNYVAQVHITVGGTNYWDAVPLVQILNLVAGDYVLTFKIKMITNPDGDMFSTTILKTDDATNPHLDNLGNTLDGTWQSFTFPFTLTADDAAATLQFRFGKLDTGASVQLDDVKVNLAP